MGAGLIVAGAAMGAAGGLWANGNAASPPTEKIPQETAEAPQQTARQQQVARSLAGHRAGYPEHGILPF